MYHPPAAGGKTAWGVGSGRTDDPIELAKARSAKQDYQVREEERLNRLKQMDREAGSFMDARKAQRDAFQPSRTSGDDFKKKNDEVMRKMAEAKDQRKLEKKRLREESGLGLEGKRKRRKKDKKTKVKEESSSSEASSSSASSSSESAKKVSELEEEVEDIAAQAPLDPESAKRAAEARAREREVKRKAAEQAAAWAAELKQKEAEAELQRQAEAKRREKEAEEKKKAEAKEKKEQEEAKRKEDEATAKQKAGEVEARKEVFKTGSGRKIGGAPNEKGGDMMIGGFRQGQTVFAAKNITVKGNVVIKMNTQGRIVGPSETNPMQRIAVHFSRREDRNVGNMNVVPAEIKKSLR